SILPRVSAFGPAATPKPSLINAGDATLQFSVIGSEVGCNFLPHGIAYGRLTAFLGVDAPEQFNKSQRMATSHSLSQRDRSASDAWRVLLQLPKKISAAPSRRVDPGEVGSAVVRYAQEFQDVQVGGAGVGRPVAEMIDPYLVIRKVAEKPVDLSRKFASLHIIEQLWTATLTTSVCCIAFTRKSPCGVEVRDALILIEDELIV